MSKKLEQVLEDSPGKKCTQCLRPIKGHPKPRGKLCTLESLLTEMEKDEAKERERQKRLENDRLRMSTPESKEANRKRMATPENKDATKKRMAKNENRDADRKGRLKKLRLNQV